MPLYDYDCLKCGLVPDIWAKIMEIYVKCPHCQGNMKRVLSPVNIIGDLPQMGIWDEVVSHSPVYFGSKQDKKRYLADRGLAIKGESPKVSQQHAEKAAEREEKIKKIWLGKHESV